MLFSCDGFILLSSQNGEGGPLPVHPSLLSPFPGEISTVVCNMRLCVEHAKLSNASACLQWLNVEVWGIGRGGCGRRACVGGRVWVKGGVREKGCEGEGVRWVVGKGVWGEKEEA